MTKEEPLRLIVTLVLAVILGAVAGSLMDGKKAHHVRSVPETWRASHDEPVAIIPPKALPRTMPNTSTTVSIVPRSSHEHIMENTTARDVATYCESLDLVTHPERAPEMVFLTSAVYETPAGLLNGVWETESDHGINGRTGSCNVMREYAVRDCWKPGETTRRPTGCTSPYIFVGETSSPTRWKRLPKRRLGNGTKQRRAVIRIARALGLRPWSIKGSCGNRTLTGLKNPKKGATHGGCFGNMQITPAEWERDVRAMGFNLSELSPFNVCDSMLVSSYRLKKHHDTRYARYMKSAYWRVRKGLADQLSWLWSGRRYYGNPEGKKANRYEYHNKWGRGNPRRMDIFAYLAKRPANSRRFPCGWNCWDTMTARNDFSPLIEHIRWRGRKERARLAR